MHVTGFYDQNYCRLTWNVRKEAKNQIIMEIRCMVEMNISKNISGMIDQKRFMCIRLCLTIDNNEYNRSFMQNFLSEWEKKIFDPKIRRIREVPPTKTNLKLSKHETRRQSITQRLLTNAIKKATYIPFAWINDYNDSMWNNDTEVNITSTNVAIVPAKHKNDLIFGYFRLYVLILLAILVILLLIITAIACYYDCENRRSHLLSGNIKNGAVPTVAVRYKGKQLDIVDRNKFREDVTQSSVHSRTLRKRKMLIEARRSASTKSVTDSEFGDNAMFKIGKMPKLSYQVKTKLLGTKLLQSDRAKDDRVHGAVLQVTEMKRSESITGDMSEISLSSSASDLNKEEKSVTGYDDVEKKEEE